VGNVGVRIAGADLRSQTFLIRIQSSCMLRDVTPKRGGKVVGICLPPLHRLAPGEANARVGSEKG
jgi:hypothetical protein